MLLRKQIGLIPTRLRVKNVEICSQVWTPKLDFIYFLNKFWIKNVKTESIYNGIYVIKSQSLNFF